MVAQEPIEDHLFPQAKELLHNAWMEKRMAITSEIQSRTELLTAELSRDADTYLNTWK